MRASTAPTCVQLERALARLGFAPGPVDGRYDAGTEAAVSNFYLRQGWAPFGPTDLQLEQLRTAQTAAAQARDAHLQALNTIEQAKPPRPRRSSRRGSTRSPPGTRSTRQSSLSPPPRPSSRRRGPRPRTRGPRRRSRIANATRDQAAADADVALKRAALDAAIDDQQVAQLKVFDVPLDAPPVRPRRGRCRGPRRRGGCPARAGRARRRDRHRRCGPRRGPDARRRPAPMAAQAASDARRGRRGAAPRAPGAADRARHGDDLGRSACGS